MTEEYFIKKISYIAHLKCIPISRQAAKEIFSEFCQFSESDMDIAVDSILWHQDKFDFILLLNKLKSIRSSRMERQSEKENAEEARIAKMFFKGDLCPTPRAKEWIKGINLIIGKHLGKQGAEELIEFMGNQKQGTEPPDDIPF